MKMKKSINKDDKSCAYRTLNFDKITAPTPISKDTPRATKTVGTSDLRGGKK